MIWVLAGLIGTAQPITISYGSGRALLAWLSPAEVEKDLGSDLQWLGGSARSIF